MKRRTFALALTAVLVAACKSGPSCPPGAQLMGAAPPDGEQQWCEKIVDGKPVKHGIYIVYGPNGEKLIEGHYVDGKQDSDWTLYYDTGIKQTVDHYRNGVQEGEHIGWYPNGKIATMGQYKNGKREGTWKRWDSDGFKNWEEVYRGDKKVS
ncbi:MAG: toxin-antitoxin system YwqK family antitoxin [Candidatus Binataceae bacterium]